MFAYTDRRLHCDQLPLDALAARYGTPLYVYSAARLRAHYRAFDRAFRGTPHTICYSVKANSNLGLLQLLAKAGAGFDVVSGGELERVLRAAKSAARLTVFSGVGKTAAELDLALKAGILLFNVESESELGLLAARAARLKKTARIALRVNPDVSAETHPYISTGLREHKFGVALAAARRIYKDAARHSRLEVAGISVHIGSQITDLAPFAVAMQRVAALARELASDGHRIRFIDAGGGLGIEYQHAPLIPRPPRRTRRAESRDLAVVTNSFSAYAAAITTPLKKLKVHLLLEPGRSLIAAAGVLLTRVLYLKQNGAKHFVIVDAAMNDLLRPALYNAHHDIVPVTTPASAPAPRAFDIVGPVCETGDFFARDRALAPPAEGDLLAILDTGAYGMSLASNYNTRPRPAEVLVEGRRSHIIRRRETVAGLLRHER